MKMHSQHHVFHGLLACMPEAQAREAAALWQERFSADPVTQLRAFVNRLFELYSPVLAPREVHRILIKSLYRAVDHDRRPFRPADGAAAGFTQLVDAFIAHIERIRPGVGGRVRGYMIDNLEQLGLSEPDEWAMLEWLAGRRVGGQVALDLFEMRKLLHLAYRVACEYVGPVAADRCLSETVQTAELPAAALDPRQLL